MVVRNCKSLLKEIHDLEEKMEVLTRLHPDLDPEVLLKLILKKMG